MLDFAAGLLDKPQQGVGDTPFDLLGRYLDYAGMGSWRREPTVCSVLVASTGISRRAPAKFQTTTPARCCRRRRSRSPGSGTGRSPWRPRRSRRSRVCFFTLLKHRAVLTDRASLRMASRSAVDSPTKRARSATSEPAILAIKNVLGSGTLTANTGSDQA